MRSRCGSYQRRARSRPDDHSEYRRFPTVTTKSAQASPARGGEGSAQSAPRGSGTDTRQQVHHAEAGDAIARIFDKAQQRQHVLDVRGVEKLQAAELDEWDVAAGEFDFQRPAMRGRTEEHHLLLKEGPFLAGLEDPLYDVAGLVGLVAHADQARLCRRGALRPKVLGEALPGEIDHAVCRGKDRLGRTIVAVERDDLYSRTELIGKIENVADGGGAEGIDRLRVVADDRKAAATRFQREQD